MKRLLPISSLISPPDLNLVNDSFNSNTDLSFSPGNKLPPISTARSRAQSDMDLPSPPVTPRTVSTKHISIGADQVNAPVLDNAARSRDPVLFPSERKGSLDSGPLFVPEIAPIVEGVVDEHIAERKRNNKSEAEIPSREDYLLAASFCSPRVVANYNRNPGAWALREREILDRQFEKTHPAASKPASKLKKIAPAPKKGASASAARVQKPQRAKRAPQSTPKSKTLDSFDTTPVRNTPKSRVIGTNRDDTDYRSLPDFCPPTSNLHGIKTMKADWKGQPLDLSNDPDRHALEPAEVSLASSLRLNCATYLCSKRRIFEGRLLALKKGKEFRKTDAQQCCKIDVNKASKLWTAFEKLGWFDPELFQQHL